MYNLKMVGKPNVENKTITVDEQLLKVEKQTVVSAMDLTSQSNSVDIPDLIQQTVDVQKILYILAKNPSQVYNVSDFYSEKLKPLFPAVDGFNHADVLEIVSNPQKLQLFQYHLDKFIKLDHSHFSGENSSYNGLSLGQALQLSINGSQYSQQSYVHLNDIAKGISPNANVKLITTNYSSNNIDPTSFSLRLANLHVLLSHISGDYDMQSFMQQMAELIYRKNNSTLTVKESELLDAYLRFSAPEQMTVIEGVTVENQSIRGAVQDMEVGSAIQIKSQKAHYSLSLIQQNGQYEVSFFDTNGALVTLKHTSIEQVKSQSIETIQRYMGHTVKQTDGSLVSRAQFDGFTDRSDYDFRATIVQNNINSETFATRQNDLTTLMTKSTALFTHPDYVTIGNQQIPLKTLERLGAHVDGIPIRPEHIEITGWTKKLSFESEALSTQLTLMKNNENDLGLLKILKLQIDDTGSQNVILGDINTPESKLLLNQLTLVEKNISVDDTEVSPVTLTKLTDMGMEAPLYQRVMDGTGKVLSAIGAINALKNIVELHRKLDDPALNAEERAEIEQELGLTYASTFFSYADNIIQPILVSASTRFTGSANLGNSLAAKVTILFNLVSMGMDAYQAYEAFSKLESTTDPLARQDLIFSGSMSVSSFVVGGITIVGIVAGSATVPVVGAVIGGVLMVAGAIYNTVRTIQEIEKEVSLSDWERLSIVLESNRDYLTIFDPLSLFSPQTNVIGEAQQRANRKIYSKLLQTQNWYQEIETFRSKYLTNGVQHHLYANEKPMLEPFDSYHIVKKNEEFPDGDYDNYFGGKPDFAVDLSGGTQHHYSSKDGAKRFSEEQAHHLINNYILDFKTNKARKHVQKRNADYIPIATGTTISDPEYYLKKVDGPSSLKSIGSETTNEDISLNPDYMDEKLTSFMVESGMAGLNSKNKKANIHSSDIEQLHLFSLKNTYLNENHPDIIDVSKKGKDGKNTKEAMFGDKELDFEDSDETITEHEENSDVIEIEKKSEESDKPKVLALGDEIKHDAEAISTKLSTHNFGSISINSGDGDDIIIGYENRINKFNVYKGNKYFAGGDLNDSFHYFVDGENEILSKNKNDTQYKKIFDGGNGHDSIILNNQSSESKYLVNLKDNKIALKNNSDNLLIAEPFNIENIFLHGKGNAVQEIIGDDSDNILDSGSSNGLITGGEGNDSIMLERGEAKGGVGNDRYYIRRYQWQNTLEDFFVQRQYFDSKKQQFVYKPRINSKYRAARHNVAKVVIDEMTASSSDVTLGYFLTEIHDITIDNNDIVLHIDMKQDLIYGVSLSNVTNSITIRLKNAYSEQQGYKALHHHYKLKTRDGFVLTNINTQPKYDSTNPIYEITYHQQADMHNGRNNKVIIDETNKTITIGDNPTIAQPSWGHFSPIGLAQQLTYTGSAQNDQLAYLNRNAYIYVTQGQDAYQISPDHFVQGEVTFDFEQVKNTYQENDNLIILLPNDSGGDLKVGNDTIYLENPFGGCLLTIRFKNHTAEMIKKVVIQDKNSQLFKLDSEDSDIKINLLSASENANGKLPDNVIHEKSSNNILISDKDNSILIANDGYNVLYSSGTGTNRLYGGKGQDLLLSGMGNDYLNGGFGNDHYLISHTESNTTPLTSYIDDKEGNNHIHLVNFNKISSPVNKDGIKFDSYINDQGHTVNIRQANEQNEFKNNVHHYTELPAHLEAENNLSIVAQKISSMADSKKSAYSHGQWRPMDIFKGALVEADDTTSSSGDIHFTAQSPYRNLIVTSNNDDHQNINDSSKHGRIFKGGVKFNQINADSGNNVFVSGDGGNDFVGGDGDDLFISAKAGTFKLSGGAGNNRFLIDGDQFSKVEVELSNGQDHIHLVNFNQTPVTREVLDDSIRFTYRSERGGEVLIKQKINTQAPSIFHHTKLSNNDNRNTQEQLDHLINVLSYQRILDAEQSSISSSEQRVDGWSPISYFDHYIKQVS